MIQLLHLSDLHFGPHTDLRLSVAALNSCEVESHRREDHRGVISREQAQIVLDAWRFGEVKEWLKVVAVHHNPVATVRANVDGWDELGDLGEELRGRLLGFMEDHPRLLVVVSSRPYGEGRPSSSEGFEVLDIQPLADGEIGELARRFYVQCYREDDAAAESPATLRSIAAGRLLCGSHPIWPTRPWQLGLLHVWPSHRRMAGLRLQSARVCGIGKKDFKRVAAAVLTPPEWDSEKRDWARDLARDLARDWGIEESDGLFAFASIDMSSFGRVGARTQLAYARVPEDFSEGRLLQVASRLSFDRDRDPSELDEALSRYESILDPLWPALARHLARRSTADDRALLEDLAQHPEKREPPLQWGLQLIVRGDVMDDDGSVVTLDELCDELGMERLPYLEEMPEEIDLGEEETER